MDMLFTVMCVILFAGCGRGTPQPSGTDDSNAQPAIQVRRPPADQPIPRGAPGTGQMPVPAVPATPVPVAHPELQAAYTAYRQQGVGG